MVDSRAEFFGFRPVLLRCQVLLPPWKGTALIWFRLIDGALHVITEIDADAVMLTAAEDVSSVTAAHTIAFNP